MHMTCINLGDFGVDSKVIHEQIFIVVYRFAVLTIYKKRIQNYVFVSFSLKCWHSIGSCH